MLNKIKSAFGGNIKKLAISLSAGAIMLAPTVVPAFADSLSINFEPTTYSLGNINGQDGWSMTGPYDIEVDGSFGYGTFGTQSFRISNAVTSGSFGDWAFSKSLSDEAGETLAQNGGMSGGTRQPYFEASFDFASTVPSAEQPGLQMSLAPDRGDGARMSFIRLTDKPAGLQVDFDDYQSGVNETGCTTGSNFIDTTVASGLDRSVPHNIKLTMQFVDGPNNDIVKVYVDGSLVHTGTSWEGYFNECEGNPTRTVDSLIFQARFGGGTAPATNGFGFVIDNLSLSSGPIPVDPFAIPPECSEIEGLGAPIIGTNGSDNITGTPGNDLIFALGGSDKVTGNSGNDCIVGGDGSDKLLGNNDNDVILGGNGSDSIEGNNGEDKLYGNADSDSLKGGNNDDELFGGDGSDSLRGENGIDILNGDEGSDSLRGGNQNDTLTGGVGVDSARGEGGTDTCDAESENTCEL